MPRYEILPGLPGTGPMAVPFGGASHSEGFVVRFHPDSAESWVGNFERDDGIGWQGVLEHPDGKHLIVVSGGGGYFVDPHTRAASNFGFHIQHAIALPELSAIVFSNGFEFEAIRADGLWWKSPRISWDGIQNITVDGSTLRGEAFNTQEWEPFNLDLMTGRCEDGVYEKHMRGAIRIEPDSPLSKEAMSAFQRVLLNFRRYFSGT